MGEEGKIRIQVPYSVITKILPIEQLDLLIKEKICGHNSCIIIFTITLMWFMVNYRIKIINPYKMINFHL